MIQSDYRAITGNMPYLTPEHPNTDAVKLFLAMLTGSHWPPDISGFIDGRVRHVVTGNNPPFTEAQ